MNTYSPRSTIVTRATVRRLLKTRTVALPVLRRTAAVALAAALTACGGGSDADDEAASFDAVACDPYQTNPKKPSYCGIRPCTYDPAQPSACK